MTIKTQINDSAEMETLCKPCARLVEGSPSVRVSPLEPSDLELVLAWRSNAEIYSHFRQQNCPFDWDEHISWYESRDTNRHDFVINFDGRRVGVISVDEVDEVDIFLGDFSARGHGVATATLRWMCEHFEERTSLIAYIHEENEKSSQLFERCGFERRTRDGEWFQYVYEP